MRIPRGTRRADNGPFSSSFISTSLLFKFHIRIAYSAPLVHALRAPNSASCMHFPRGTHKGSLYSSFRRIKGPSIQVSYPHRILACHCIVIRIAHSPFTVSLRMPGSMRQISVSITVTSRRQPCAAIRARHTQNTDARKL
jgi:hypothetical protein